MPNTFCFTFKKNLKTKKNTPQNVKSIGEKLKNKGLMLFVSFVSCNLQDFNF